MRLTGLALFGIPIAIALGAGSVATECRAAAGFDPPLLGLRQVDSSGGPLLAQRVIEREWGLPEDSVYVEKEVPGIRSEAIAGLLSAAVPGSGQLYVGGTGTVRRGAVYALAEVVAWTARIMLHQSGEDARADAERFAGVPTDPGSAWSMQRWAAHTKSDPKDLARLYAADPEAFYDLIENDPQYLSGWDGDESANQQHFVELRAASDRRLHGARVSESLLWVNHAISAFDALRAARLHNVALTPALGLKLRTGYRHGKPEFMATLVRRF